LQKINSQYEKVKREDAEKQKKYLDGKRTPLINKYDKSFWEMKPAAKLTGKDQSNLRKSRLVFCFLFRLSKFVFLP
jgi:hypothetical protein